jgi:vaccinia related kinase
LQEKKLSHINLPLFLGNGSLQVQDVKHRFIVTNKFGKDLWSLFKTHKKFPFGTVLNIAKQTVNILLDISQYGPKWNASVTFQLQVLEYIHSKDYVHCDVKGANLLIGNTPSTKDRVYLVDFGLASKGTVHEIYTEDARKICNGTIEYLSRDAHRGGEHCQNLWFSLISVNLERKQYERYHGQFL